MTDVLIICAHRRDRSPSQRYRFEQYLDYLETQGFRFIYSNLLNENQDRVFYSDGHSIPKMLIILQGLVSRIRDIFRFSKFKIVFIQREASFVGGGFFEKAAFKSGARVIFDFDDSIWLADTSPGNKKWEWLKKPGKFFDNVTHAHTVIAGNNYLAAVALEKNKNTVVIPTTIDTDVHVPKPHLRNTDTVVIGWSGSISTIKHFNMLIPALIKIREKYGRKIVFRIIADKIYKNDELPLEVVQWRADTEVDELNKFDIGLMPLPDDEWSRGKCGLKGLSYMACGVATIMSPVGVNTEIISPGINGLLAASESEWVETISSLVEDPLLRKKLGEAGRETVINTYSVKAMREKYLSVFNGFKTEC